MRDAFKAVAFENPAEADSRLASLLSPERPGLEANLSRALAESSNPSAALLRIERFLEGRDTAADDLDLMASEPRYALLACTVLAQSHYLTDVVCRHPDYVRWLWEGAVLDRARTRGEMASAMLEQIAQCESPEECGHAMRRFKSKEILRIATREIVESAPIVSSAEDLSYLADATLEAACGAVTKDLHELLGKPASHDASGEPHPVTFAVIGLGKLGGTELNFSSDIDLIFIFSEEGETLGGHSSPVTNGEYFQKLGERLIKLVSEQTADGMLFRVDMRLRPYGRLAPLAISLDSAIDYYSDYAQGWERQALIKARPVAGDLGLGQRFIDLTRPIVFPRYFDDETLEEIRDIKRQMELQSADRGETATDVKLGRGGIRDIEFTVQMLQMLNGGRMPELRVPRTLDAIKALGKRAHLTPFEATALASNYAFLRQVEHRLQIEGNQQRHVLPPEGKELDELARKLGYRSATSFMAAYRDRGKETRDILERFFATEGAGNLWTYDLLSPHTEGKAGMLHLEQCGFKDPGKARAELRELSAGTPGQPHPFHIRRQFASVVPGLLEALSQCANPDATLIRLSRIFTSLRAPGVIYSILEDNRVLCEYLTTLVSNSDYLSEILIRDPGLFDILGSSSVLDAVRTRADLEEELASLSQAHDAEAAPYRLRDGETLRIGLRGLCRGIGVAEVGRELTQLAEVCLEHALGKGRADVLRRYGRTDCAFAILALGKLGGREMGYGSDLDLVFVYEAGPPADSGIGLAEYSAAVAAAATRRLKEPTRHGLLYDVDTRLRPDGNKGVLAVSADRLEQYYREEAEPWELLALMKVRAVAGDAVFGREVECRARDAAFGLELTREKMDRIDELRAKIASKAAPLDIKKQEGGIAELEFCVRLLQLRHVAQAPELKRGDVLGAIGALASSGVLPAGKADALRAAYLLFRTVENRIRIMHGRSDSTLPSDPEARAGLAGRLGIEEDLAALVARHAADVHEIYEEILRGNRPA